MKVFIVVFRHKITFHTESVIFIGSLSGADCWANDEALSYNSDYFVNYGSYQLTDEHRAMIANGIKVVLDPDLAD